jgi:hypothetical protein
LARTNLYDPNKEQWALTQHAHTTIITTRKALVGRERETKTIQHGADAIRTWLIWKYTAVHNCVSTKFYTDPGAYAERKVCKLEFRERKFQFVGIIVAKT